jgi:hypothetical protein
MFQSDHKNESDLPVKDVPAQDGREESARFVTFTRICASLLSLLVTVLVCLVLFGGLPEKIKGIIFMSLCVNIFASIAIWWKQLKSCFLVVFLILSIPAWIILWVGFADTGRLHKWAGLIFGGGIPFILLVAVNLLLNASLKRENSKDLRRSYNIGFALLAIAAVVATIVYATVGLRPAMVFGM